MAAQNARSAKSRSWIILGCVIATGLALVLVVAGGVAYLLLRPHPARDILTTRISSPDTGQRVQVHQPVDVMAEAANLGGASRVEVYADGALILAQDSSGQGETQLTVIGSWVPLTMGRHALMARGYSAKREHADSEIVYVDVQEAPASTVIDVDRVAHKAGGPNPSLDALAAYLGTTTDELRRRNPGLGGSGPSDPLPSGSHVDAPPRTGSPPSPAPPPPPPSPALPAAPTGLAGSAADCFNVVLTWTASPDAQTYRVYRYDLGSTRAILVADGLTATSHSDPLPAPGDYWYQVASVRDGDEGPSLLLRVPRPATCPGPPAPPEGSTDLALTVAMVETDAAWEGIYCFISVNGGGPERIPAGDFNFVAPDSSTSRYYNLTSLPGAGPVNLIGQPVGTPVTLSGECVARTEPTAPDPNPSLGTFSASHPQADWDGTLRSASGGQFRFSYCIGPGTVPCTPTIPEISPPEPGAEVPPFILTGVTFYFPAPTNVGYMPGTDAWSGVDSCSALPDPIDQADCIAAGTAWGRQMILWDWVGNALFSESSLTGYTVQRTNLSTGATDTWEVTRRANGSLPKRFFSTDRDMCGARAEYRVRAHQTALHSDWSEPISFATLPCLAGADMVITFERLVLSMLVDQHEQCLVSCGVDNTLEVYGSLLANGGSMAPTEIATHGVHGISLEAGTYSFASLDMYNAEPYIGSSGPGHNVFRTRISDSRQTISFRVWLTDVDTAWDGWDIIGQDVFCDYQMTLPGRDPREWSTLNETHTLTGPRGSDGKCEVQVHVVGAPVP